MNPANDNIRQLFHYDNKTGNLWKHYKYYSELQISKHSSGYIKSVYAWQAISCSSSNMVFGQ